MEAAILGLLDQHGPLDYERIAELSGQRPGEVRQTLERLRERGVIDLLSVGEFVGKTMTATSYWRLTEAGREELARG